MASRSRAVEDWSPASVFGATAAAPTTPRRRQYHDQCHRSDDHNNDHDDDEDHRSPLDKAKASITPELLEDISGGDDEQQDDAARVLQRRARVWLLRRRERESLCEVEQLRHELEQVAASAITAWLRRTQRRLLFIQYASRLRERQRQAKCETMAISGDCLVRWLRWQLRRRIAARRRIACWWRRVAMCRRRSQRDHASRVLAQCMGRAVRRRRSRARHQAIACVGAFLWKIVMRRRALREMRRLRQRRSAVRVMASKRMHTQLSQALALWQAHTQLQRRRHDAACVLQRLVRVVLTAFRLLRRRDAATLIQRRVCAHQRHRRAAKRRQERRERAATHIQRIARGFIARRCVARLLQQLRERFRCRNCGLIEPGGRYCKLCGWKRATSDVLRAGDARSVTCTTDAKLRKKRRGALPEEASPMVRPPPPPLPPRESGPAVWVMAMPELALPAVHHAAAPQSPADAAALLLLPSPVRPPPRKPAQARAASGGRPPHPTHHRSLSLSPSPMALALPAAGACSVDKTRQRAEALLRDSGDRASSATMTLHLKRLHNGGKAASR